MTGHLDWPPAMRLYCRLKEGMLLPKLNPFFFLGFVALFALAKGHIEISHREERELSLKQEVLTIQINTIRNLMREQDLAKRNFIVSRSLEDIEMLRQMHPVQVGRDERLIEKTVQNLRLLKAQKLAQYKGTE